MIQHLPEGRKIKLGLVGCGRISKSHFQAMAALPESIELVAVCDTLAEARQAAALQTNARSYSDLTTLLHREELDAVVLTTPSGLHSAQAIEVARSRRHVITEKPMATTWSDACAMVRACEENSVHLLVVKQNRLNPTLQQLKRAVDAGQFKDLYLITANVFWTRPQAYYDAAPWRGTWALDGGALMNQASHYVDLLCWLFGPIVNVHAHAATLARDIEAEDTIVVSLQWASGAMGSLNVTMLTYPHNLEGSITVLGQEGTVRIGGKALNEIQEWRFPDSAPVIADPEHLNYEPETVYGNGHLPYYRNVVDVLRGRTPALTNGREGLKSLEVILAAYASARDGHRVSLPFSQPPA